MEEKKDEKLEKALLKVALGFQVAEVTEEYAEVDGELKLTKRKETKKDIPPDLKAVQLLLAGGEEQPYSLMSDEELEAEKNRLLAMLEGDEGKGKTSGTSAVVRKKTTAVKQGNGMPKKRKMKRAGTK